MDDCTCVTTIFLMKEQYEVFIFFVKFFHMIKTQFGKSIKRLCSNNGRNYVNHYMSKFLYKNDCVHEFKCVDTPQQKDIVERKNNLFLR